MLGLQLPNQNKIGLPAVKLELYWFDDRQLNTVPVCQTGNPKWLRFDNRQLNIIPVCKTGNPNWFWFDKRKSILFQLSNRQPG